MTTSLVVRLDSAGDVLLAGPAVRAVAAASDHVVLLCGPQGEAAARLLPGVDEVVVWRCPWVVPEPSALDAGEVLVLAAKLGGLGVDRALVLTSYHQSPLPTALLLRLAGVPWVGAVSEDYPGALLDLRHRLPEQGLHEAERMLSLAVAAGCPAQGSQLAVRRPLPDTSALTGEGAYVVVHPFASVPSRSPSPAWSAELVRRLQATGRRVVVTGAPGDPTGDVAGDALDLGGRTDLAQLADVLDRADAVVVGNTGPAHLAAAVGTPVVSLFAPVVPAERWRPHGVPHVLLGDQQAACAGSRARTCPVAGHPCLDGIEHDQVLAALEQRVAA